jgi:hypothetical protein
MTQKEVATIGQPMPISQLQSPPFRADDLTAATKMVLEKHGGWLETSTDVFTLHFQTGQRSKNSTRVLLFFVWNFFNERVDGDIERTRYSCKGICVYCAIRISEHTFYGVETDEGLVRKLCHVHTPSFSDLFYSQPDSHFPCLFDRIVTGKALTEY